MSTADRQAIRTTLAQRAGSAPDTNAFANATLDTWRQMADRLTPVIGGRGVDALFSRALHLTIASFPWLTSIEAQGDRQALQATLKARLADQETATAAEAGEVLLATFTELLATLIGESLTERLLDPVWSHPSPAAEKENAS